MSRFSIANTKNQLSKLLSYRKADILNTHAEALRIVTAASNVQSTCLTDLAKKARQDSRSTRIITAIATVYLPASLLAVSSLLHI